MLIGGAGRDAERVARQIVGRTAQLDATADQLAPAAVS
jgi:hypothetical protein